jgi:hypothetical protein
MAFAVSPSGRPDFFALGHRSRVPWPPQICSKILKASLIGMPSTTTAPTTRIPASHRRAGHRTNAAPAGRPSRSRRRSRCGIPVSRRRRAPAAWGAARSCGDLAALSGGQTGEGVASRRRRDERQPRPRWLGFWWWVVAGTGTRGRRCPTTATRTAGTPRPRARPRPRPPATRRAARGGVRSPDAASRLPLPHPGHGRAPWKVVVHRPVVEHVRQAAAAAAPLGALGRTGRRRAV